MQIRTWFGVFTLENGRISCIELYQKDIEGIVNRLAGGQQMLRGKIGNTDIRDLAVEHGFVPSYEEYDSLLHEINIRLVKKQMALSVTRDRQIIAAVEAIDDISSTANILAERLREWYLLFNDTDLQGSELAQYIIGSNEPYLREMRSLASAIIDLYKTRSSIEEYLKDNMPRIAPNLSCIAGPILGARLLSTAGSLEKLASMPSSTVQVIGANNALFKHLKGKAPSPKHGLIFRHPLINTAPKRLRGKIARALASKISLAVRCDFYSGELKGDLAGKLDAKVSEIKKRYSRKKM